MNKYLDKAGLQEYTTKLTAKYDTRYAKPDDFGSPLVAATAADMTDHDKVYVYVGSETGYTSGNWYYWNGTAWASGGVYNSTAFVTDTTLTQAGKAADAKATGDKFSYRVGANLYDEEHNGVVQADPQYKVGTVYLNGYVGNLFVSCSAVSPSSFSYVSDLHVYNASDEDMGVSFGTQKYDLYSKRVGKVVAIPENAARMTFKYRIKYSGGDLVKEMMVSIGDTCPVYYEPYKLTTLVSGSDYLTTDEYLKGKVAYVSLSGSDDNDGQTFDTAFATIKKALSVARTIFVERGEYTFPLIAQYMNNIKILPYNDGTAYDHAHPNVEKITFDRSGGNISSIQFVYCNDIYIEDVIFIGHGSSVIFQNCDKVHLVNCEANDSVTNMGFDLVNTNGVFDKCYASGNHVDGFNFHGYGSTIMNDCLSENNDDDGCSHHDGCVGFINGGEFNGNGKAGIAPAYGAQVNINNASCKENRLGIAYLSTNNGHAAMKGQINSCAMIGNTESGLEVDPLCTVVAINCKYSGNTTDKNVTGTLTEY